MLGDVNGDGKVDSTDAIRVRRHYLGLYTLTGVDLLAAKVTPDSGGPTIVDATRIRRYYLGLYDLYG